MFRRMSARMLGVLTACVLLGVVLGSTPAVAQCEFPKLQAYDGTDIDGYFGSSVGVSGDTAVIGASEDYQQYTGISGAAFVYSFDGSAWGYQNVLVASDAMGGDLFGSALAIDDDTIVVGAEENDDSGNASGSAYVFRRYGPDWFEEAKLIPLDGAEDDHFGSSTAVSGDTVVIGAPWHDGIDSDSGAAYVFAYDGWSWTLQAELLPSDAAAGDYFGSSVAIAGETIVVCADGDDDAGSYAGAAYVFSYDGLEWVEVAKLLASDGAAGDYFGSSVAISDALIVVGAEGDDDSGTGSGSAYVFSYDGLEWVEVAKLLATDGTEGDYFGSSVATSYPLIAVGAEGDDDSGGFSGSAYVFSHDGSEWVQQAKLVPSDVAPDDHAGSSVDISGETVLIGAPYHDQPYDDSGAAYVFDLGGDCNENGVCDATDIAGGFSKDCNGNAIPDECDIADGTSEECNGNGVPDECEVPPIGDPANDCNGNEIPDACDVHFVFETSSELGPIGDGVPQSHTLAAPPLAGSDVELTFEAIGDFVALAEWVDVDINGVWVGRVFGENANDCPSQPDVASLVVPAETYNFAMTGTDAVITMTASPAVNPYWCLESFIAMTIQYQGIGPGDCNGNGVPDICDILQGTSLDNNGNWIPDECEVLCHGDLDGDNDVDLSDLTQLLGNYGTAVGATYAMGDIEPPGGDGDVDLSDLTELIGVYGTTCE